MKGSTRKYVDKKYLLCSTKFVYICIYIYVFTPEGFLNVSFKLSRFLVNIKMVFSPLSVVGAKLPDDPLR